MPARAQRTLLSSLAIGLALCLGDIALGGPIKHMHKPWPTIPVNAYDREIICFALFAWPAALIVFGKGLRCSSIILLVVCAVATLFSQSHSAMVGIVLGLGVFAASWIKSFSFLSSPAGRGLRSLGEGLSEAG